VVKPVTKAVFTTAAMDTGKSKTV